MSTDSSSALQAIPADKIYNGVAVPCSVKHGAVMQRCLALPVGDDFVLRNDQDPAGIQRQLAEQYAGCFTWRYLEQGPEVFSVRIDKLRPVEPAQS
jgi:uncharacterized protein (DUF2249 family)